MDRMLTTQQVMDSRVASLPYATLKGWITRGLIVPEVAGSQGRGNATLFTKMQAVGVAVAAELTRKPRGCDAKYVEMIVRAFGKMPEPELRKSFKRGAIHFLGLAGTDEKVHLDSYAGGVPRYDDQVDVQEIYERVCDVAERLGVEG